MKYIAGSQVSYVAKDIEPYGEVTLTGTIIFVSHDDDMVAVRFDGDPSASVFGNHTEAADSLDALTVTRVEPEPSTRPTPAQRDYSYEQYINRIYRLEQQP